MEWVWNGYGTGMERVWSRLPPNPLQLRSSAEVDRGEKSIKNDGSGTWATFPPLPPSFYALFLFPETTGQVRNRSAPAMPAACLADALHMHRDTGSDTATMELIRSRSGVATDATGCRERRC